MYKITEVRKLFTHCNLQQSVEGRPWRVFTNDTYLAETAKLLAAIEMGTTITQVMVRVSHTIGARIDEKTRIKQEKQQEKRKKREQCTHYEEKTAAKIKYICCEKLMCMSKYKCSLLTRDNIPIIQFFRNKFLDFGRETKRVFLANRLKGKNPDIQLNTTEYYLENIDTMQYYIHQGVLPLQPSCAPQQMVKVCNAFFRFVLQVSQNKLYQPTVEGHEFSATMNITRNPYHQDYSADDSVRDWLTNYAEAHLHDPSKDTIILSIATRKAVYETYENDFRQGVLFYFPKKNQEGQLTYYLPSCSHFMRCWRTIPALKKIVLRKYLRFALCDLCIDFRERRRYATSDEERKEIKKQERLHHIFVHEERGTYYVRRCSAIHFPDQYMSIIADGADQSAYGLPHFIEIDKFSSSRRKIPVYLMGVLVHGFRAYGFTYLKNVKHGTNIVIECLHYVFMDYYKHRKYIPAIIYLQLDNTWKQNKNKYMLGYLACLVAWGVCRQVIVSFLPVGHTHEDIGREI